MFQKTNNPCQQGTVGLGAAIAYFTAQNQVVSVPLNDSQKYDLVVDDEEGLLKVQVKTTYCKSPSGAYCASLRTCGGNQSWSGVANFFDNTAVDILFVLCEDGSAYCIPAHNITCKSSITLGKKYEKYKIIRQS